MSFHRSADPATYSHEYEPSEGVAKIGIWVERNPVHHRDGKATSNNNQQEYVRLDTTSSHLFFVYGQLQPGPGLSSKRPVAVHTLSLSRPLEQKLVA